MTDRVIIACAVIIALVYFYGTAQIPTLQIGDPLGPKAFPIILGLALLISAGLLLAEHLKDRGSAAGAPAESAPFEWQYLKVLGLVAAWTAGYYVVLEPLGYVIATTVFLLALMAWFNRGRWRMNVLSAVVFGAGSYVLFVKLDVNLPKGVEAVSPVSAGIIAAVDVVVNMFSSVLRAF